MAVNPVGSFIAKAIAKDVVEFDKTTKEELYLAYVQFCKINNLVILSKEIFGKILKRHFHFQDGREPSGEGRTV